jgi:aspartate aminotransferase
MRGVAAARAVDQVIEALSDFPGEVTPWLVGEPCFEPPAVLVEAVERAARQPHYGYSPVAGLDQLRQVVAALHGGSESGLLGPEHVTITHGAKSGLLAVLAALLQPGDRVLVPLPCFPAYPRAVELCGGVVAPVVRGLERHDWSSVELDGLLDPTARALILASPCNPSGATLSAAAAEALVAFCRRHGIVLISDEAYEAFRYEPASVATPALFDPERRTVVQLRSFSKTYAVCGWRVGSVIASPELSRRIAAAQGGLINPPNTLAQMALCSVAGVPSAYFEHNRRLVRSRLELLSSMLRGCGLGAEVPQGGFYLWIDLREALAAVGLRDALQLCVELAASAGVGLWPGEDYMAPGWARLSAVAPAEAGLERANERLERGVLKLLRGRG